VLHGVGQEPTIVQPIRTVLHFRRSLTEEEMKMLTAEWLAIPARDEFSESGEVEYRL
jgi:hypothetical protein